VITGGRGSNDDETVGVALVDRHFEVHTVSASYDDVNCADTRAFCANLLMSRRLQHDTHWVRVPSARHT